jgi:predicted DCC family thiol-disulfide oxidoreductase YuxK
MGQEASDGHQVAHPPGRPLLIFDGECGFCRRWIERWRGLTRGRVDYAASQDVAGRFPEIPQEDFDESVRLVDTDGTVTAGAEAVYRALALAPNPILGLPLLVYRHLPGARAVAEWAYRAVARRRRLFSGVTRLLWGHDVTRPTYALGSELFLRLLAVVYLIAFASLWLQIDGLVGSEGVLPAGPWLEDMRERIGTEAYRRLPTLAWLDAGDGSLHLLSAAGVVLSLFLVVGLAPVPILAMLWALYLSLVTVGQTFLSFQWDILLLETGFLAIWLAPLRVWPTFVRSPGPSRVAVFLLHWLLFRLMFSSGIVKLLSGDAVWWDLTALEIHYETQPLPTWTAWYVHQLPGLVHRASCLIMFVTELAVPFLIFAPRRLRHLGCAALVALQVLIAATGNYTFFNLLTILLCVTLVDDSLWPRRLRERRPVEGPGRPRGRWPLWALAGPATVLLVLSLHVMGRTLQRPHWLAPSAVWDEVAEVYGEWAWPLHVVNSYGLFANMTESRPEIVIEGSDDLREWEPYEFRWKPGDPSRRPRFVAPHQPRLDWQMWFAALGDYRQPRNRWFGELLERLLEGSPAVLGLLAENPFPDEPPRFVRAVVYDYRFTDFAERRESGHWWRRESVRLYLPVVRLSEGRLQALRPQVPRGRTYRP